MKDIKIINYWLNGTNKSLEINSAGVLLVPIHHRIEPFKDGNLTWQLESIITNLTLNNLTNNLNLLFPNLWQICLNFDPNFSSMLDVFTESENLNTTHLLMSLSMNFACLGRSTTKNHEF